MDPSALLDPAIGQQHDGDVSDVISRMNRS